MPGRERTGLNDEALLRLSTDGFYPYKGVHMIAGVSTLIITHISAAVFEARTFAPRTPEFRLVATPKTLLQSLKEPNERRC